MEDREKQGKFYLRQAFRDRFEERYLPFFQGTRLPRIDEIAVGDMPHRNNIPPGKAPVETTDSIVKVTTSRTKRKQTHTAEVEDRSKQGWFSCKRRKVNKNTQKETTKMQIGPRALESDCIAKLVPKRSNVTQWSRMIKGGSYIDRLLLKRGSVHRLVS